MPPERTRLIDGQFTADPSAHAFDCGLYFFPSHDQDNASGFNMIDYHVFSLQENGAFRDHGVILSLDDVPWAKQYAWAPDAAYKNGKYYFYFPAKDNGGIFHMGVAVADRPEGPYKAEAEPIPNSFSIDPTVFVDDDGTGYMVFGGNQGGQLECYVSGSYKESDCTGDNGGQSSVPWQNPWIAKFKDNMIEFDGAPKQLVLTGGETFFEGAWLHKYNDTYYLSYSTGPSRNVIYATSSSAMGPYTHKGTVLPDDASQSNLGWTTHHSIVAFQGKWYLFYHDSQCSSGNTTQRCVKYAELTYKANGDINPVQP
ncbi:MAG: family 43 glycosylhydrolase [Deltaproteobacteria bacterium]|nr:family 43 glycosylhydrolase [Deltaproteobacteria bacterium]